MILKKHERDYIRHRPPKDFTQGVTSNIRIGSFGPSASVREIFLWSNETPAKEHKKEKYLVEPEVKSTLENKYQVQWPEA